MIIKIQGYLHTYSTVYLVKALLLVNAGLGISDLVERGHFKSISISSLTLVHVVPECQNNLEELLKVSALQNLFRGFN